MNTEDKNWKNLEEHSDDDLWNLINLSGISKIKSHNPLIKIKKNLLINMAFGVLICCLYVFVIVCFNYWQVRLALAIVLLFSLWALSTAFTQYRGLNTDFFANGPVLAELKKQQQSIFTWMHSQTRVALLIYPVSAAGGFMLGGAIGSGKAIGVFISKPMVWVIFLVVVIILVPLCHQLTKWMFRSSFGKYLDDLQKKIAELETEK